MIWAFDVRPEAVAAGGMPFPRRYFAAARAHGVLLRPIGNTVYLMPPYVLSEADNEHLARGTVAALDAALAP
jgi:adenosylmethionine-8-amino-7-oxononanoate aminotransferase